MKKWLSPISLFLFLSFLPYYLSQSHAAAPSQYLRPPPRQLIFTHHSRSESEPEQVHVSLVGKDHIRVSWITAAKHHTKSIVEYGKLPGKYDQSSVQGSDSDDTSYRYFFYTSGKIHHTIIGPLEPNTTYYYRCGGSGPEFSFKTPPSTFPIEFVIVGDLGQTEWTVSTLSHIGAKDYDVLLLPGDLSYADTKQPLWDSFGRLVEPYASSRPWMVTEGNHEIEIFPIIHSFGFKAYNARWLMPYKQSSSNSNLYYSFDTAGCHVIMLGSYAKFDSNSYQHKWLRDDIGRIDRGVTPWVFAVLHAPWYNSNAAHKGEGESMRKAMEKLLYDARVDAVFAGHVHAYERFTRVFDNKADPCGPVYLTVGDGGNREGLALSFENPKPEISVFREASFGHGRLRVYNETHAHWSWQRHQDTNSAMADEVWLESLSSMESCRSRKGEAITGSHEKDEL